MYGEKAMICYNEARDEGIITQTIKKRIQIVWHMYDWNTIKGYITDKGWEREDFDDVSKSLPFIVSDSYCFRRKG